MIRALRHWLRPAEWKPHTLWPWQTSPVPGARTLMWRFIDGRWEWRAMTPDEAARHERRRAW